MNVPQDRATDPASGWAAIPWVLLVVAIAVVASIVLIHRRRSTWRRFAQRHGLDFEVGSAGPRVAGSVAGRTFVLEVADADPTDRGVEPVRASLALRKVPPRGLRVRRAPGAIGDLQRSIEEDRVATGDPGFDEQALVQADEPSAVAWLTTRRRVALLELFEQCAPAAAGIEADAVFLGDRAMISSVARLERHRRTLIAAAERLDAEGDIDAAAATRPVE